MLKEFLILVNSIIISGKYMHGIEFVDEGCGCLILLSFPLLIGLLLWVCWHVCNESKEHHRQEELKQKAVILEIQQNRQKLLLNKKIKTNYEVQN